MASGSPTDKNIKGLCFLLLIIETRIAITIMTNQHQHQDCEEDLIIAQFYSYSFQSLIGLAN